MLDSLTPATVFLALVGGILPALFWLWFWLQEDNLHPEPRRLLLFAFLLGMAATALSYPLEMWADTHMPGFTPQKFLIWAIIEEGLKWLGIIFLITHTRFFDEPIDAVMYTVTGALGFAALENAMFLIAPLGTGDHLAALRIENFRFIGATLLHVSASAIPGIVIATMFFHKKSPWFYGFLGLLGAIALHTAFNVSIMESAGNNIYMIFLTLWGVVLGILYCCEKIKRMHPTSEEVFPKFEIMLPPTTSHRSV